MVARNKHRTALLILDMISEFAYPDGSKVLRSARHAARAIARLKARASTASIPVIYINDTAGKWESDQRAFVKRCLQPSAAGRDVVELIRPGPDDYFIFKPKHSAFFDTPLPTLLSQLSIGQLILTGVTSHQCVLFTAMDAHVREFDLIVPADCIGAATQSQNRHGLFVLQTALRARTTSSSRVRL